MIVAILSLAKKLKRINHKEQKEVTKTTKLAIIAPRGQEVAKTVQPFL